MDRYYYSGPVVYYSDEVKAVICVCINSITAETISEALNHAYFSRDKVDTALKNIINQAEQALAKG